MKFAISMLGLSATRIFLAYFTMQMCFNYSKQWWVMAILTLITLTTHLTEEDRKGDSA